MQLILASNSPRRKELLESKGYKFRIIVSDYEERVFTDDPVLTAVQFSKGKALSVFDSLSDKEGVAVIGSDTVVYHDGSILGKPKDENQAKSMLKSLSGKTHEVISGYAIVTKDAVIAGYDITKVTFNELTDQDINRYIESGLYKGKAGAYGIQDGYKLVKKYEGSLNNVIGLPTEKLYKALEDIE